MRNNQYVPQFQVRSHVHSGASGGYVDGVWYPDQSGVCGGSVPQPLPPAPVPPAPVPPSGGGYVGGVWYADRSGVCG
jgi:hypothetical protein